MLNISNHWKVNLSLVLLNAFHVSQSWAQPAVIAEAQGVVVTTADIDSEVAKLPPEQRKTFQATVGNISQIATNLLVRRRLANEAAGAAYAQNEIAKAALAIGRDRVLSELAIAEAESKQKPSSEALDKYAEATYRVDAKRFENPEQINISHILFRNNAEGKEKAAKYLTELRAGKDFAEVAKAESMDLGSASRGGDLGFQPRGKWVPAFEQAAWSINKPGEIIGPVETEFGIHLMMLKEKKPASMRPYAEVREQLKKEAEVKFLADVRKREMDRMSAGMKINTDAVAAWADQFVK